MLEKCLSVCRLVPVLYNAIMIVALSWLRNVCNRIVMFFAVVTYKTHRRLDNVMYMSSITSSCILFKNASVGHFPTNEGKIRQE